MSLKHYLFWYVGKRMSIVDNFSLVYLQTYLGAG